MLVKLLSLIALWITVASLASMLMRYCKVSGYLLENQIYFTGSKMVNEYHLVLCIDGKFIYDTRFPSIPWGTKFAFGDRTLAIARSKRYATRKKPIFPPYAPVAGIFDVGGPDPIPLAPLQSRPITEYWIEIKSSRLIAHVPILETPIISTDNWYANFSVTESYSYSPEVKPVVTAT